MNRKIIIEDEQCQSVYELVDEITVVGRDAQCDLVLSHQKVSRRHLQLSLVGDDLLIEDLGSGNGTLLGGELIDGKRLLKSGDLLEIGDLRLWVDHAPAKRSIGDAPPSSRRIAGDRKGNHNSAVIIAAAFAVVAISVYYLWPRSTDEAEAGAGDASAAVQEQAAADAKALSDEARLAKHRPRAELSAAERQRIVERSRALTNLKLEVELQMLQECYGDALAIIDDFEKRHEGGASSVRRKVEQSMEQAHTRILLDYNRFITAGQREIAAAHLRERLDLFPEPSLHRDRLRKLLKRAAAPVARAQSSKPETGPTPTVLAADQVEATDSPPVPARPTEAATKPAKRPRGNSETAAKFFFDDNARADRHFLDREFREAATIFSAMVPLGRQARIDPQSIEIVARKGRIAARLAVLKLGLNSCVASNPETFTDIPCLPGRKGNIKGLGDDGIIFDVGGSELTLGWKVLHADAVRAMIKKAKLEGPLAVGAATFLFTLEKERDAISILRRAQRAADAFVKSKIDETLADARNMGVPKGGFIWHEDDFITPRDLERLNIRKVVDSHVASLQDRRAEVRKASYDALTALGGKAASAFHRAILASKADLLKNMEKLGGYSKLGQLASKRQELDVARDHALELIFDTEKYPYPYRGRGKEIRALYQESQTEIDKRVRVVRDIWSLETTARISKELRAAIDVLSEYNAQLEFLDLGFGPDDPIYLLALSTTSRDVTIRSFAVDEEDRLRIDTSEEWIKLNQTAPSISTGAEKRQIEVTNEYRMMMGRHAVRMHEQLLAAARGHSMDMANGLPFSHTNSRDPKKRTPRDRVVLAGFRGVGVSENIAATGGGPDKAHSSWCHSSGHHRNILNKSWRLLGTGNGGSYWTQNFSIREYTEEELEQTDGEFEGGDGLPEGGDGGASKEREEG